jgi:dienelactone hydrolase
MNANELLGTRRPTGAIVTLLVCLALLVASVVVASLVQRDFGGVEVSNVTYENYNGILIRAKLLRPMGATAETPVPGVVYIHGYQNNRETSDAYVIELARRGVVVLSIDAIGRGNSGIPGDIEAPDFDPTYGGRTSLEYLRDLPFVDAASIGLMGHSLGAEMVYTIALEDPDVDALVISGFGYDLRASESNPRNMLMIIGQYDEYRERMTGVDDIEQEWLSAPPSQQVFPVEGPQLATTYGDFTDGTARRVVVLPTIHIQESHSREGVAEALEWMKAALTPPPSLWVDADSQLWPIKEWATLIAMLAGLASLLPLTWLLLRARPFESLRTGPQGGYANSGHAYLGPAITNSVLMWLYLPLIFALFGLHVYVLPIDGLFPMMMVNGTVWWFVVSNLIGFMLLWRWFKRRSRESGLTWAELGISYREDGFALDWAQVGRTALLALILFGFAYLSEHLLEQLFVVDYRFIFPFASDLTSYRWLMFLIYFPFLLIGFLLQGFFLHGQMRREPRPTWLRTFFSWTGHNLLLLIVPLVLFMMVQYVPLLTAGKVLLVGPGGMLASFTMNLFHIIGVLLMTTPISTWCYQLTGRPYLGAFLNAALVTWMFVSSQVIAPIPV